MSLACGHPVWLALRSIESDAVLCELCEARSRARDAESEEQRLRAELADTARALGEKCSACEVGRGLEQRAEYAESRLASISGVTRQALVERAVRATIEAAAEYIKADRDQNEHAMSDPCWNGMTSAMELVTELKTAPIVARVLGGGT